MPGSFTIIQVEPILALLPVIHPRPPSAFLTLLLTPLPTVLLTNPHERGSYATGCKRTRTHCGKRRSMGLARMIFVSCSTGLATLRILHKANQFTRRDERSCRTKRKKLQWCTDGLFCFQCSILRIFSRAHSVDDGNVLW